MKRNIVSIVAITMVCIFIAPNNFAQNIKFSEWGTSEQKPITSRQLFNIAKDSNVEYVLLNQSVERAKDKYRDAVFVSSAIQNDIEDPDEKVDFERRKYLGLKPLETKKSYEDNKYKLMQFVNDLEIKSIDHYFTLLILENDLNLKRDYYEYMKQKNESKQTELKLGNITELDMKIFANSYEKAYIAFLKASNEYANQKRELNLFIDRDPESPLYLKSQPIYISELKKIDLEKTLKDIIDNSYRIQSLELERDITEAGKRLKSRYKGYGDVAVEIDLLDDKIVELNAQIEDEKRRLKLDLYSGYENSKIASQNAEISNIEKEIAKKNYEIAKLKFDNGMISVFDLNELYNKYELAYYNAMKSELSQKINLMEFDDFIGENTVNISE